MASPMERSKKYFRDFGVTVGVVERWNPHARIRQDLFGCIDLIALPPTGIMGVQVTSGSNVPARVAKAMAEPQLREWLQTGGRFVVHGWRKLKEKTAKGKTVERWRLRTVAIVLDGPTLRSIEA